MMSTNCPNEIWTSILSRIKDVKTWGRLESVNRQFNALIASECWPKVNYLFFVWNLVARKGSISTTYTDKEIPITHYGPNLDITSMSLLLKKFALNSPKIVDIRFHLNGGFVSPNTQQHEIMEILGILASGRFPVTYLEMYFMVDRVFPSADFWLSLANFTESLAPTLEDLTFLSFASLEDQPSIDKFAAAINSCQKLKTLHIDARHTVGPDGHDNQSRMASLLGKAVERQSVDKITWQTSKCDSTNSVNVFARSLLESGVQVKHLDIQTSEILTSYGQLVLAQNLLGTPHPLTSVENLEVRGMTKGFDIPLLFSMIPNIKEISITADLWVFHVDTFINQHLISHSLTNLTQVFIQLRPISKALEWLEDIRTRVPGAWLESWVLGSEFLPVPRDTPKAVKQIGLQLHNSTVVTVRQNASY